MTTRHKLSNDNGALPKIILGSSSPRRKELLGRILAFESISPDIEEIPESGENPEAYTKRNAITKAAAVMKSLDRAQPTIVISCDTIVVLGDEILEKPQDKAHAFTMLKKLSGRTHTVISAVCIQKSSGQVGADQTKTFTVETQVRIKNLSDQEIHAYIETEEPMDKAGSYAAQGIGSYMIEQIKGSYSNVVGLPMCELVSALREEFDVPLW